MQILFPLGQAITQLERLHKHLLRIFKQVTLSFLRVVHIGQAHKILRMVLGNRPLLAAINTAMVNLMVLEFVPFAELQSNFL